MATDQKLTQRPNLTTSSDSSTLHVVSSDLSYSQTKADLLKEDRVRITNLESNQVTGVETYAELTDLPVTGTLLVSYKVTNDTVSSSNNGYYHWDGAVYVKDASLYLGEVVESDVEAVEGGKIHTAILDKEIEVNGDSFNTLGYIKTADGEVAVSVTRFYTDYKNISTAEKIIIKGYSNGTTIALLAYYDIDKVYISSLVSPVSTRTEILKASFPVGAVYIRCSASGDGSDYLIYSNLDEVNDRLESSESNISTLQSDVSSLQTNSVDALLITDASQAQQFLTINDTPTDLFSLSQVVTEAAIATKTGYGNNILPTSTYTVNMIKLIPADLMVGYNDFALVEIYNVTDDLIEFSYKIRSIEWNANEDEKITIALDSDVTLTSGKSYQIRYRIEGVSIAAQRYKRVPKVNNEVPTRTSYFSGTWVTSAGDFNVLIEAFNSTDYLIENKLIIEPEQVIGLEAYIESLTAPVELYIPDDIYVAVGTTIEIYNDQILDTPNKSNFHIDYSCTIGQHKKRKFTIEGLIGDVGTHTLTITVRNNSLTTILTKVINLEVVNNTIASPYRLLPIGASFTNDKLWYDTWKDLVFAKTGDRDDIDFVGTIVGTWGNHEGRSGWTSGLYNSASTDENSNIILTVSGVTEEPVSKKAYNVPLTAGGTTTFEVEIVNLTAGAGTIQLTRTGVSGLIDATGIITEVESGTFGDASITFTVRVYDSVNPFWNDGTNSLDFANYSTVNSIAQPDGVQFLIGTNSLSSEATIDTANLDLKAIIDQIIVDWGAIDIFICLIPFFSNQDGLGITYGSGSFGNKEDLDKKVFYTSKTVASTFSGYANVFLTPIAQTHDSEFNFGKTTRDVNPRTSEYTIDDPIEGVHPQDNGYNQFADTMFSTWLKQQ